MREGQLKIVVQALLNTSSSSCPRLLEALGEAGHCPEDLPAALRQAEVPEKPSTRVGRRADSA
jgi:hypothetical protein